MPRVWAGLTAYDMHGPAITRKDRRRKEDIRHCIRREHMPVVMEMGKQSASQPLKVDTL